jgi:colanic acid biosynthesis glycosyl transferase WcaI
MKVLIVSQYFWPESFRINDLVSCLVERGHQVTVLTGKPNYPGGSFFPGYGFLKRSREKYAGATIIRVPLIPRGKGGTIRLALNYLSFACLAAMLAPFRCRDSYDVIFVFEPSPVTVGLPAIVMKWIKRAPILFWVQDLWPESLAAAGGLRSPWFLNVVKRLVVFIYRNCDLVLIQSRGFNNPVREMGVLQEQIRYFPNWAEDAFDVPVLSSQQGAQGLPAGFRIIFAGNFGAAQSLETIVKAAMLVRNESIHWVFLGSGRRGAWLENEIAGYGLSDTMHVLGRKPVEDMPRYFASADVLLVTLRKDPIFSLTIPSKVQTYLAAGRPILGALDGEGARIIEEAHAGIAVPAENAEALARAILRLYRMDRAEREAMGKSGMEYSRMHFNRNKLLKELDEWMLDAAGRSV